MPPLLPPDWESPGPEMDPEWRSPGSECPPAICLLRNHEAPAHGYPLEETGGKSLRKHAKKATEKRGSLVHSSWVTPDGLHLPPASPARGCRLSSPPLQQGLAGSGPTLLPHVGLQMFSRSFAVCNPTAGSSLLPVTIPRKMCIEPKCPAHGVKARRKTSRTNHNPWTWRGSEKCCWFPLDDPKPSGMATRPYTHTGGPTAQPPSAAEPTTFYPLYTEPNKSVPVKVAAAEGTPASV